jgi:hypothetical protein
MCNIAYKYQQCGKFDEQAAHVLKFLAGLV